MVAIVKNWKKHTYKNGTSRIKLIANKHTHKKHLLTQFDQYKIMQGHFWCFRIGKCPISSGVHKHDQKMKANNKYNPQGSVQQIDRPSL
jgi:GT2 family glycosyltransferase